MLASSESNSLVRYPRDFLRVTPGIMNIIPSPWHSSASAQNSEPNDTSLAFSSPTKEKRDRVIRGPCILMALDATPVATPRGN